MHKYIAVLGHVLLRASCSACASSRSNPPADNDVDMTNMGFL